MTEFECRVQEYHGDEFERMKPFIPCIDHADAAKEFARYLWTDCDGWEWMEGEVTMIDVRAIGETEHKTFKVCVVEFSPEFNCTEA